MSTSSEATAADKNGTATFKGISQHFKEEPLIWASRNVMIHLASPLISQMGISEKTTQPLKFLDLACGTGIATDVVQKQLPRDVLEKSGFLGTDSSETMTDVAKKRIELEGWVNTTIEVKDAFTMNLASGSFTHIATALALHMIPDPDFIVKDAIRMLKPGGVFGATTFSAANGTQWFVPDLDSAFQSLDIGVPSISPVKMQVHDSGIWTDAKWIESQLKKLGLVDVTVKETPGSYHFENADQWVTTFGGMVRWQMSEKWDEEMRSKVPAEEMIEKVREHLVEKYDGQGWDVHFTTIVMTGKAPS